MRKLVLKGLMLATGILATPAMAQRANENAVNSADDAFGTSVGSERVGLYNPYSARGFSPVEAGNVRIEGLYFDLQADLTDRIIGGSNMRIGLTAQGYPFPAPTGIADFSLRKADSEAVLSTVVGVGPFGGVRAELDGQLPLTESLSLSAGAGINREEMHFGGDRTLISAGIVPRWRPSENIQILPFWGINDYRGQEPQTLYFTSGAFLPPRIARRDYHGPEWARSGGRGTNYGVISAMRFGDWSLQSALFRSVHRNDRNFVDLALNVDEDGYADRLLISEKDRRFGSVSGELRLSRRFDEGNRRHIIHLAARGREQKRRYGGGQSFDMGRHRIDEDVNFAKPQFTFGPQLHDQVRQFTGGIGYEGRWTGVGELSLGLQKTSYRKEVDTPSGPLPESKDSPWLMNGALSVYATRKLVLYAGYTKGLEESPVAPEVARNKDEAAAAIITSQMDAGVRYLLADNLRLVAGVFDVKKPYYSLDETNLFTKLGELRHRGIELSLAGELAKGLNVVVGTVFLDAEVSGEEVEKGLIGKEPLGAMKRYSNLALDYQIPWVEGLSFDVAYESTSKRTSNRQNTLYIPPRYVASPGFRYRFKLGDKPVTLRGQVGTINNVYGYGNAGSGFVYNQPRRYSLTLYADL